MVIQAEATYHGTIGFLIFYKRGGQNCVRVVPEKVRQNDATKASARLFGKASGLASAIRKKLAAVIPFPDDILMQTRFISVLFQWMKANVPFERTGIKKLNLIRNFQFTTTGPSFSRRCKIKPEFIHSFRRSASNTNTPFYSKTICYCSGENGFCQTEKLR